eukprot:snap_masked-scaffold_66-processed-gene-0.32-mRNA-1 protein AED:0.91 eAED:0.91 QI:0/-1/0/1/-1/1/1/0/108
MEIVNMIGGSDGDEVMRVEVNEGKEWRFDPGVVKMIENMITVNFPKGKQELKMLTIPEIVKVQEECEIDPNKLEASRNESGAWINKQGKLIIPGELVERFIVTAHNAS